MTEELKQKAEEWCKRKKLTPSNVGYFTADYCEQSYIAGATEATKKLREEIAELQATYKKQRNKRIDELQKENAELKEKYDTCLRENTGLKIHNAYVEKKITKAKDYILKLTTYLEGHTNYDFEYELIKEVKQFLKGGQYL